MNPNAEQGERYRLRAARFLDHVRAVAPGQWDDPSPNPGWRARDVVGHVINGHRGIVAMVYGIPPQPAHGVGTTAMSGTPAVAPDADLVAAFTDTSNDLLSIMTDPDLSTTLLPTPLGVVPVVMAVDTIGALELIVHTWDLARSIGADDALRDNALQATYDAIAPYHEALLATGAFVYSPAPPIGADLQTRFLALSGRQP